MTNLAVLGLAIDSSELLEGTKRLDVFAEAAARAERAAIRLGQVSLGAGLNQSASATASLTARIAELEAANNRVRAGMTGLMAVFSSTASNVISLDGANARARTSLDATTTAALKAGDAYRRLNEQVVAAGRGGGASSPLASPSPAAPRGPAPPPTAPAPSAPGHSSSPRPVNDNYRDMLIRDIGFQAKDFALQVMSGSSPLHAAMIQGPQVAALMQMGGLGPRDVVEGLTSQVAGLARAAGPAGFAVGGVTAALLAATSAYNAYDVGQKQIRRSLIGAGRESGLTPGDIMDIAQRSPLTDALGQQAASALAATGNADRTGITRALAMAKDLGATMGTGTEEATKALVDLASGGGAALDSLNARYRFLSAGQRQYILDLQAQGKGAEAFAAELDALSRSLGSYNDLASVGQKISDRFFGGLSQIRTGFGSGVASLLGDDRVDTGVQGLTARRASLTGEATALNRQLAEIENGRKRLFGSPVDEATLDGLYPADKIRIRLQEIAREQEDVSRRITAATQAQVAAQRAAVAEQERMQTNRIQSVTISIERQNDLLRQNPTQQRVTQSERQAGIYEEKDAQTSLERYSRTYQPYRPLEDRRGSSLHDPIDRHEMPAPVAPSMTGDRFNATFGADKEAAAAGIRAQQLEGNRIEQGKSLDELTRAQTLTLDAQTRALGQNAGAQAAVAMKSQQLIALGRDGNPISADILARIDRESAAYGRQAQTLAELQMRRDLVFERDQLSRTPVEAGIAARLRPTYGDNQNTDAAKAEAAYMRTTQGIQQTQQALASLGQMGSTLLDPLFEKTRSWGDAFSDVAKQISKALLMAELFGSGPFAGALGTQGAGGGPGGAFGALVTGARGLFGFADGGVISGPGGPREDRVMARLSPGEFVVNASAASRNLDLLHAINGGRDTWSPTRLRAYASGGLVAPYSPTPETGDECFCDVRIAA